jgi:hypothetical protein
VTASWSFLRSPVVHPLVHLKMLGDEADASRGEPESGPAGNFGLTNSAADLSCKGNDETDSQGYYDDYHAHAQVFQGGADPLGSQGYASAVRNPSSS